MSSGLQLENSQNWQQVWVGHLAGAPGSIPRSYQPILPVDVPILLENPILAVTTSSQDPYLKPRWYLGCWAQQMLQSSGFGNARIQAGRRICRLNATTLLVWQDLSPQYGLRLEVPFWIAELDVYVWQYQGPRSDTNDELEALRVALARVEFKLDLRL